ncbi:DUF3617 domain-containing protein [Tsuneonella amylolytica]|uniref:DUF3617 domain-containing protein n=1 Tax=Tsuneonella amylolytica TaxID=2338327 RepID=UPI001F32F53A|nr:hypothetical protein [Tsuneonella amylolytica]
MLSKTRTGLRLIGAVGGLFLAGLIAPAAAQGPALTMLSGLDKGQWELRYRDGAPASRICVRTGRELLQIKHGASGCNRFVVEDAPGSVTVQYTCRGNGYGRTSIRRETKSLVQVDSQGIAGGTPFEFSAEARKIGPCR